MFTRERVVPLGHQQITDVSSATSLTVPTGAQWALIACTAQNVRWRDDGTAPTASVGQQMLTTDPAMWYGGKLSKLQFIQETSTAILEVTYYG